MTTCNARTRSGDHQCTEPKGHEKAHARYEGGRFVAAWLTPGEFEAAKARGDFDQPDYCRCSEPVPVCDDCGGEIL